MGAQQSYLFESQDMFLERMFPGIYQYRMQHPSWQEIAEHNALLAYAEELAYEAEIKAKAVVIARAVQAAETEKIRHNFMLDCRTRGLLPAETTAYFATKH